MKAFKTFLIERQKSGYQYSSTQINLPADLAGDVFEWGLDHIPDEYLFSDPDDPTFGREDEPHITVLYGIHDRTSKKVADLVSRVKPFEVKLKTVSLFTNNDKFDVVKIDVSSPELMRLNKLLVNNLEATQSYPEYHPHVTIAYVRKGRGARLDGAATFARRSFTMDHLIFSSRTGEKTKLAF